MAPTRSGAHLQGGSSEDVPTATKTRTPQQQAIVLGRRNAKLTQDILAATVAKNEAVSQRRRAYEQLAQSVAEQHDLRARAWAAETNRIDHRTPENPQMLANAFKNLIVGVREFVQDQITIPLLEADGYDGPPLKDQTETLFAKIFQAKIELGYDLGRLARTPGATESSILESMIWRILIKRVFIRTQHRFEEFYQTPEERTRPPMSDRSGFQNAARYVQMIDSIFFSMADNLDSAEKRFRALSLRSRALDNLFRGNHLARTQVDSGRNEGMRKLTMEMASRLDVFVVDQHHFVRELRRKIVRPAVLLMERFMRDQNDYQVNMDLFTPSDLDPLGEDAEVRFRETLAQGTVDFCRVQRKRGGGYTELPRSARAHAQVDKLCGWTPALMEQNRPSLRVDRGTRVLVKQKMTVIGKKSPKTRGDATFMSRLAKQRTAECKPRLNLYADLVPHTMRVQVDTLAYNSDDSMASSSSYYDSFSDGSKEDLMDLD